MVFIGTHCVLLAAHYMFIAAAWSLSARKRHVSLFLRGNVGMFLVTYKTSYKCCYSYPEVPENDFGVRTYHEIPDASHKLKINEKLFKKTSAK